jgi:acetyl esterase/lipase
LVTKKGEAKMMARIIAFTVLLMMTATTLANDTIKSQVQVLLDVPYKTGVALTDYERERCRLDVYLPQGKKDFPTLVWFHGGGLKAGDKSSVRPGDSVKSESIAQRFAEHGIAVVVPNYRLSPKATYPAYVQDAAAAVLWAKRQMPQHGANSNALFVGGHSAGGYLALMLAMDTHYLKDIGVVPSDIAGIIPVSGQTMTHYTVREERGIGKHTITVDDAAPVHFTRADTPPALVIYADHDMAARAEENMYFVELMKDAGNKGIQGLMVKDRTHGSIASELANPTDPGCKAIFEFIAKYTK